MLMIAEFTKLCKKKKLQMEILYKINLFILERLRKEKNM